MPAKRLLLLMLLPLLPAFMYVSGATHSSGGGTGRAGGVSGGGGFASADSVSW